MKAQEGKYKAEGDLTNYRQEADAALLPAGHALAFLEVALAAQPLVTREGWLLLIAGGHGLPGQEAGAALLLTARVVAVRGPAGAGRGGGATARVAGGSREDALYILCRYQIHVGTTNKIQRFLVDILGCCNDSCTNSCKDICNDGLTDRPAN